MGNMEIDKLIQTLVERATEQSVVDGKPSLEIERHWLLKTVPTGLTFDRSIDQYYMMRGGRVYRVRKSTYEKRSVYHFTHKKPRPNGGTGFVELECEIDSREFRTFIDYADRYVIKNRFVKKGEKENEGLTWEIDNFVSITLLRAEIELPDDERAVVIQDWLRPHILVETTDLKGFSNFNFSKEVAL